jgi:hypothetical protein
MHVSAGATRTVLVTRRLAIKFPRFYRKGRCFEWSRFLQGLLANLQERYWSRIKYAELKLCPVLFADPIGLVVVMPRCEDIELLDPYFERNSRAMCPVAFEAWRSVMLGDGRCDLPVENMACNFGYLNGRLVSFDYGT